MPRVIRPRQSPTSCVTTAETCDRRFSMTSDWSRHSAGSSRISNSDMTSTPGSSLPDNVSGSRRMLKLGLFRVVQESLRNVERHSNAANVEVCLEFEPNNLTITVQDDGCGFVIESMPQGSGEGAQLGILGMRERVRYSAGTSISRRDWRRHHNPRQPADSTSRKPGAERKLQHRPRYRRLVTGDALIFVATFHRHAVEPAVVSGIATQSTRLTSPTLQQMPMVGVIHGGGCRHC